MKFPASIKIDIMETKCKDDLKHVLLEECFAMVKHLSADGKSIPDCSNLILNFDKADCYNSNLNEQQVVKLHNELSKFVAPARPQTLNLLQKEAQKNQTFSFLGSVTLVKRLMLVAIISLVLFIAISLSSHINGKTIDQSIYDNSSIELFIVLSFYLTSASLGAAFSNLFQANNHIKSNTFDPKYESSYWIRYVLGIIAGFLLAVLIPLPESITQNKETTNIEILSKPLLAMLGGFSAALVYRILFRMVFAVESIFIGKQSDIYKKDLANAKKASEMDIANEKQKMVNHLLSLQGEINKSKTTTPEEMSKQIQSKIEQIIG